MKTIAMIGLGMVSGTHAAAIADTGDRVVLGGVMSTSPDKARAFAADFAAKHGLPQPKVYESVEQIASDPEIDFALVCTPPNARQEIVDALVAARKPILLEKPIERTLEAAEKIVATCESAGVPLGIMFQHRVREASVKLAGMLKAQAFGEIALVEIVVPWWREQAYYNEPGRGSYARDGGGVLISQAIHTMDLALSLVGPVSAVQAMARTSALHSMESEDVVTAGLEFASGAIGTLYASTASFPGRPESITVHGTKGSALLARGELKVDLRDGSTETFGAAGGTGGGADPMAFTHAWHQGVIEDFAEALDAGRPPRATGREALEVHRLITALETSSREGRLIRLADLV